MHIHGKLTRKLKKSQKMRENKNEKVHEMLDQVQLSLLEQQLLNLLLDGLDLRLDLRALILGDTETPNITS